MATRLQSHHDSVARPAVVAGDTVTLRSATMLWSLCCCRVCLTMCGCLMPCLPAAWALVQVLLNEQNVTHDTLHHALGPTLLHHVSEPLVTPGLN